MEIRYIVPIYKYKDKTKQFESYRVMTNANSSLKKYETWLTVVGTNFWGVKEQTGFAIELFIIGHIFLE